MRDEEVQSLIDTELTDCTPEQKVLFAKHRVPLRATLIERYGNLESAFVAAQRGDEVMYYEDIEGGWNFSPLTAEGHIAQHWCNQDELKCALWRWMPESG